MKYRLYVDEVGTHGFRKLDTPEHCCLSLTGVIFELEYARETLYPKLEELKQRYFHPHPDEPLVLHRKEMMQKNYPYTALRDDTRCQRFNDDLIALLGDLNYSVVTATIDKARQKSQYGGRRFNPYHYCMEVIVERFTLWLDDRQAQGDVMAEARGTKDDQLLSTEYTRIYESGTAYVGCTLFQQRLTSKQLKISPKDKNVAGLQIADLIAYPSFLAMLAHQGVQNVPPGLDERIVALLEASKYRRSSSGKVEGYGTKWLP